MAAIVRRDFITARSYRSVLVIQALAGALNVIVYYFISKTLGAAKSDLGPAPSYFDFAVVGMAVSVVIQGAANGIAQRVREEQLTGTLEALVVQPVSAGELSVGLGGLPFLIAVITAVLYILVAGGLLGLELSHVSWLGFAVMLLLSGIALSAIGVLAAAVVLVIKRGGQALVGTLTFGLVLIGGALFPISVLPDWIEPVAKIVPTRFAFDGLRAAVFGGSGWGHDALILVCLSAAFLPVAVWLFDRALETSKRRGSIAQY